MAFQLIATAEILTFIREMEYVITYCIELNTVYYSHALMRDTSVTGTISGDTKLSHVVTDNFVNTNMVMVTCLHE